MHFLTCPSYWKNCYVYMYKKNFDPVIQMRRYSGTGSHIFLSTRFWIFTSFYKFEQCSTVYLTLNITVFSISLDMSQTYLALVIRWEELDIASLVFKTYKSCSFFWKYKSSIIISLTVPVIFHLFLYLYFLFIILIWTMFQKHFKWNHLYPNIIRVDLNLLLLV